MLPSHKHKNVTSIVETDQSFFGPIKLIIIARMAVAELVGTAMLVLLGCMGGVTGLPDTPQPLLNQCLVWGFVVMLVIQTIGHISKCHINPAVTLGLLIFGDISPAMSCVYIVCQCIGSILGYGLLMATLPLHLKQDTNTYVCVCQPAPEITLIQAVLIEMIVTGSLVFVVCGVFDWRNATKVDSVPIKFGITVAALAIVAAPYTGAAMNPARAIGPVIWTGLWKDHWVYWLGSVIGTVIVATFYRFVLKIPLPIPELDKESEVQISVTSGEEEDETDK